MTNVCHSRDRLIREGLQGYVGWLRQVPWQLFCTLTFAWRVSDSQANGIFRSFIDRLEKRIQGPIAFVRGDEKRFSGCGKPAAPRHFHVLMTAHRPLGASWIADSWRALAGRRENGAGADVRRYDPDLGGLSYTLKFISQPGGNWDMRNLDLFLVPPDPRSLNCRQRRRLFKQKQRLENIEGANAGWEAADTL